MILRPLILQTALLLQLQILDHHFIQIFSHFLHFFLISIHSAHYMLIPIFRHFYGLLNRLVYRRRSSVHMLRAEWVGRSDPPSSYTSSDSRTATLSKRGQP